MISLANILIAAIIGAYVGRFLALTLNLLPGILLDDDEEREPEDLPKIFFQKPHCWNCQEPISFFENLPIIGYLLLRGKCKKCHQPLGKRLFILEVGLAILFGISLALFGLHLPTVFVLIATTLLIGCFITDYEHKILPDQFTLTLLWVGLIASLFPVFVPSHQAILGAVFGYGFFWSMNVVYRFFRGFDGMFPGDFKLNAAIGALVGFQWLVPITLISFLVLIITAFSIFFLRMKKIDSTLLHEESPYGCYSSLITIAVLYLFLFNSEKLQFMINGS